MKKKYPLALVATAVLFGASNAAHAAIMETAPGDGDLHLIYAPSTGDLTVAVNGNPYGTVTLSATTSVFKNGVFGTSPEFYSDDSGVGLTLGFGVLTGQQTADVTLPGVLDPNLSEAALLSTISVTAVTNGPAPSKISFSGGTAVPEPASLALMGLGGLTILSRRRKV